MSTKLPGWETCLSFMLGASIALLIASVPRENLPFKRQTQAQAPQNEARATPKPEEFEPEIEPDDDDGDARTAMTALNESAVAQFQRTIQKTVPWADLSPNFIKWSLKYPSDRRKLEQARSLKSQACRGSRTQKPRRVEHDFSIPLEQPKIIRVLAPEVNMLLQEHCNQGSMPSETAICSALVSAVKNGKTLWCHFGRAVIQLDEHIVVKIGDDISPTDADTTSHIFKHSSDIPAPQPLGIMSIGKKMYMFMTLLQGDPLDKVWPSLSDDEKISIRDQLDVILKKLRALPLPSQYLGGGDPPQCIDCRMFKRESPTHLENEAQFNAFLLSGNRREGREPYVDFVRPMLREGNRIVMTHGDLHPRNIMVIKDQEGIRVTGLIDWEYSGAYPEYWEFVKSLNTMFPVRAGDWCFFLPQKGMGAYFAEFAIDRFLENCVT
ncbi:hypothetical protein EMCG_07717 [[Emmonsia] crescens]|uniref:Aminoglycoside phosphotransferase domain-containing protein n=1 Tax=[Emmonsia] crescens TaxID=73230 RepID=A0A0G2I7W7_9EURO|nr:hypothetical protein EMCG_07717 [Emmonsia crescens UAMH 3008]